MNEMVPISVHFNYMSRLPFQMGFEVITDGESAVLLPVHILIRLLKSIIESIRLCLHKLPKHLVISISSINSSAKSGRGISQLSPSYRQNAGLFSQGRQWVQLERFSFSPLNRAQSIVPGGGCDFYQLMFGRCSDRASVKNSKDMNTT